MAAVEFPEHPIGINDFCNRVNEQLDLTVSKKLSGKILNDRLKQLGILSEKITEEGKKQSITNDTSERATVYLLSKGPLMVDRINKSFLMKWAETSCFGIYISCWKVKLPQEEKIKITHCALLLHKLNVRS